MDHTPLEISAVVDGCLTESLTTIIANNVAEDRPAHVITDALIAHLLECTPPHGETPKEMPKRWRVLVDYAPEADADDGDPGGLAHAHHFHVNELAEIHQIIEDGPAFDRIRSIEIRYALGDHSFASSPTPTDDDCPLNKAFTDGMAELHRAMRRAERLQAFHVADGRGCSPHKLPAGEVITDAEIILRFVDGAPAPDCIPAQNIRREDAA